jgi:hypothetical protein
MGLRLRPVELTDRWLSLRGTTRRDRRNRGGGLRVWTAMFRCGSGKKYGMTAGCCGDGGVDKDRKTWARGRRVKPCALSRNLHEAATWATCQFKAKKKESGKSPVSVCSVEAATKNSNARSGNAYRHTALSIVEAVRISFLFFPIRISFLFYDRSDAMCFPVRKFQASDVSVLHVQEYLPTINRNICLRSTSKRTIGQSHC